MAFVALSIAFVTSVSGYVKPSVSPFEVPWEIEAIRTSFIND